MDTPDHTPPVPEQATTAVAAEIPVLTRKVHVVDKTTLTAAEMDSLVAQLRDRMQPEMQALVQQAKTQMGDSIESIEQVFRQAMEQHAQMQLQALEQRLAEWEQLQAAHWAEKIAQFNEDLLAQVNQYARQLQAETCDALLASHQSIQAELELAQRANVAQQFTEMSDQQVSVFQQQLAQHTSSASSTLQAAVVALVNQQLADAEPARLQQMRANILEVLSGIRLTLPPNAASAPPPIEPEQASF